MCTSAIEAGQRECDRDRSDDINQDKSVKENTSSRDAFAAAQMRLRHIEHSEIWRLEWNFM